MSIAVPLYGFGIGGSSLYYSVVCSTTEPAKKEGRIWVKSSIPMTQFEVGRPWTTAKVGVVLITGDLGGSNPTSTNKTLDLINTKVAGIQNRLKLTPVSCKQIQGSAGNWVNVDAYVCHSDAWVQFSSTATYLYKSGDPDTGIWSTYDPSYSDLSLAYGTNLVFTVPTRTADFGNRANMYTETTDLAEFNTLEFRLKNTKTVKIGIASSLGEDDNSWISYTSVPENSEFASCVIDVSAISSGIVAVRYDGNIAAGGCTITFENIILI